MREEILTRFPPFVRVNGQREVEYSHGLDGNEISQIQTILEDPLIWGSIEHAFFQGRENIEKGPQGFQEQVSSSLSKRFAKALGHKQQTVCKLYHAAGSSRFLIMFPDKHDFLEDRSVLFPEAETVDFMTDPQLVIERIVDLVRQSVQFERFDLIRVNRSLKRYNFEYSIGVDIEGVIKTAYKEIANTGLAWIFNHEKIHLVENLDLNQENYDFSEDSHLYQTGFRSVLRVPIIFNHGIVGAIMLASMESGNFQAEDAFLLEALADFISQAFFHSGFQLENQYQILATSTLLQAVTSRIKVVGNTEFLNAYCQALCDIAGTERIGLFIIDEKQQMHRCIAEVGKHLPGFGEWHPIRNTAIRELLKYKSIVTFNLGDVRFEEVDEFLGQGFTAILYAPIYDSEGRITACLGGATSDESAMSKGMAGLFKTASEQLSYLLTNSSFKLEENTEQRVQQKPSGFAEIIGSSKTIFKAIDRAAQAAEYDFPILLLGETGTGKELFAKAIHRSSPVANGPFIVVNSAAIPENLLESELFGYQEGTFTGGVKGGKKGKFLLANGGTLFLDEMGELSLELQAKLLRVIQEKEIEPLGSTKPIPVDVKIISATHRNLKEMVERHEFREDLYYRLNSIEIQIPPLRERGKDVIELAESMLESLARKNGKRVKRLAEDAVKYFMDYNWPGNVRQLQNVINWLFVFSDDDLIRASDLPAEIKATSGEEGGVSEKEQLERLLQEFKGNKTALAQYLGITRTGLWKKLKRLGIQ